jgi:acetoin utilization deacetylase AcuC-like enzyme
MGVSWALWTSGVHMTNWIYGFIAGGCFFNVMALVVRKMREERRTR